MKAIRLTKLAEELKINVRTCRERFQKVLEYAPGKGRGGKIAVIRVDFIDPELHPLCEDFELEASLPGARNDDPGDEIHFTNAVFISAKKCAGLLGTTERSIRIRSKKENWKFQFHGSKKFYCLTSLPVVAQMQYHRQLKRTNEKQSNHYELSNFNQRDDADKRLEIIKNWQDYRIKFEYGNLRQADLEFIEGWNLKNPDEKISRASLHRWLELFRNGGLEALAPRWDRKPHHEADFSQEALAYFLDLWLDQKQRDAYTCYSNLRAIAKVNCWIVPSYSTCARRLKNLSNDLVAMLRYGQKAFENEFPCIIRDRESLEVGAVYCADDRKVDFSYGQGRKGQRVWVTSWIDFRTLKVLAVHLPQYGPSSQGVLDSFYIAAMEHIPRAVIIDNGPNYKESGFTPKKIAEIFPDDFHAPFEKLLGKENVHFALRERARTKIIERGLFREMARWLDKNMPGYTGANTGNRPTEQWNETKKKHGFLSRQESEEVIKKFFFEYWNNWAPNGRPSPNEMWHDHFKIESKRRASGVLLRHVLLPTHKEPIKVRQNGLQFGEDTKGHPRFYWHEAVHQILQRYDEVMVKYNENDPEKIWAYAKDGTPLCEVPLHPFSGVAVIGAGKIVGDYEATRKRREKEIIKVKAELPQKHGVDKTIDTLLQRHDLKPAPDSVVDEKTGEIFEKVDEVKLNEEIPPSFEEINRHKQQRRKERLTLEDMVIPVVENNSSKKAWKQLDSILGGTQ